MAKKETASTSSTDETKGKFKSKKVLALSVVVALLVVALAGWGAYAYKQNADLKKENTKLSDPQEAAKAETEKIKREVATLIDVPQDETPTIASVVDVEKLKNQAFFAKAQNGDKVIMYQQAKKAILYRPSTKKIIEVAPINIGNTQAQPAGEKPAEQPALAQ